VAQATAQARSKAKAAMPRTAIPSEHVVKMDTVSAGAPARGLWHCRVCRRPMSARSSYRHRRRHGKLRRAGRAVASARLTTHRVKVFNLPSTCDVPPLTPLLLPLQTEYEARAAAEAARAAAAAEAAAAEARRSSSSRSCNR
jgi:hypothetical protein